MPITWQFGGVCRTMLSDAALARNIGVGVVRTEFGVGDSASSMDARIAAYWNNGVNPIRVQPLAGFDTVPSTATAQALRSWADRFGPSGSYWVGKTNPMYVRNIEFGNENSYQYKAQSGQYDDNGTKYLAWASNYAQKARDAAQALSGSGVGLLVQLDNAGGWRWVEGMAQSGINMGNVAAGWVCHPYGPNGNDKMITDSAAAAGYGWGTSVPWYVTEWGLSCTNPATSMNPDNYGWANPMSYSQAASTINNSTNGVAHYRSYWGSRLVQFLYYMVGDDSSEGSNDREGHFGLLTVSGADKGTLTAQGRSLAASTEGTDGGGGTTAPANTSVPTISGTPVIGNTLTRGQGTYSGTTPITYTYQWQYNHGSSWANISGATSTTWVVAASGGPVAGDLVRVAETATNSAGNVIAYSAATVGISSAGTAPVNTVAPSITGTPNVGNTLNRVQGTYTGSTPITYTYQWQYNNGSWVNISGATGTSWVVTLTGGIALGNTIRVVETASNIIGGISVNSAATAGITSAGTVPLNTSPPTITGSPLVGNTLTRVQGTWTGTAPITYTYQWQYNRTGSWINISGATSTTWTVDIAGAVNTGDLIRVQEIATNAAGSTTIPSAQTSPVSSVPNAPVNTILPTVAGSSFVGQTLMVVPGVYTGTTPITDTYQWQYGNTGGSWKYIPVGTKRLGVALSSDQCTPATAAWMKAQGISSVTARWEMKPDPWNGDRGPADTIATFCRNNGFSLRIHCVVWHIESTIFGTVTSKAAKRTQLQNFATSLVNAYGDIADVRIDVANECLVDGGGVRDTPIVQSYGGANTTALYEMINDVVAAVKAVKDIPCVYNEYGYVEWSDQGRQDACVAILQNTNVDGLGCQYHPDTDAGQPTQAGITAAVKRITDLGKEFEFTEVGIPTANPTRFTNIFTGGKDSTRITFWGGWDSNSDVSGGPGSPSQPWNSDLTPKSSIVPNAQAWANTPATTWVVDISGPVNLGHEIRFIETAANSVGNISVPSIPTAVVSNTGLPPTNISATVVTGTPIVGNTLTASPGTWTGTSPITLTYQWDYSRSPGIYVAITGATNSTWTVDVSGAVDVGDKIRVREVATNVAGFTVAASSDTTAITSGAGGTAPIFGAAGAGNSDGTGSLVLDYPTGITAGQVLLMHLGSDSTGDSVTTPSGWTLIAGPSTIGSTGIHMVYLKVASGSESGTLTISWPSAIGKLSGRIYRFTGANGLYTTPISAQGTGATISDVGITTDQVGQLALNFIHMPQVVGTIGTYTGMIGGTWVQPVAAYAQGTTTDSNTIGIQAASMNSIGTIDGGTATITSNPWGVIGFALKSAAPAGGIYTKVVRDTVLLHA